MTRSVTHFIDADTYWTIVELVGYKPYQQAIGYLSSWSHGSDNYPEVAIYGCSDGELYANYIRSDGSRGYSIGAIWHPEDQRYSFHS